MWPTGKSSCEKRKKSWIHLESKNCFFYGIFRDNNKAYIVCPLGERPINASNELYIEDGILDGMKAFLRINKHLKSLLCEPYDKDYCAAAAWLFRGEDLKTLAHISTYLPYFGQKRM